MKIAIIGASTGQLPICRKAHEMGLETLCFAWEQGAICKNEVDHFYPISVTETDRITQICREEQVQGVVTNASDLLAQIAATISTALSLPGNDPIAIANIRDKHYVRQHTTNIPGLTSVHTHLLDLQATQPIQSTQPTDLIQPDFPVVIKPLTGASKQGVTFVQTPAELDKAITYAQEYSNQILIEQYIDGREISVESISYQGHHHIIQITDKDTTGYPHFVEIGHHQPSSISPVIRHQLEQIVPQILDRLSFQNGATHIEFRIGSDTKIYLIEVNPRGGGDHISDRLVQLSTGYDYLKAMIQVALGQFDNDTNLYDSLSEPNILIGQGQHVGIIYLCKQNQSRISLFCDKKRQPWLIEKSLTPELESALQKIHNNTQLLHIELPEATGNYDRCGYLIYQSDKRF